jgi:hypothetical protein
MCDCKTWPQAGGPDGYWAMNEREAIKVMVEL